MVTAVSEKINTSNFTFVGIKDQYLLAAAVRTEVPDKYINFFSQEADLISYVDVSYTGFDLPAVEIIFSFTDRELLPYLCEKSVFVVSIGKDIDSQIQSTFNIITKQVKQEVTDKWVARIVGIYNNIPFIKQQKKKVHRGSSVEIAAKVLKESLGQDPVYNVDIRSKDSMLWIQPNESNYIFLYRLWKHAYIPNSIWLSAIDFDGRPRITDLRKQAKKQPEIMLTTGNASASNTYSILDRFDTNDNSSISNNFGGYTQSKPIYDLERSRTVTAQKKESVILSESDTFNKAANVQTEAPYTMQTSNVHENFYSCAMHNISTYLSIKAFQLDVSAEGTFIPVHNLDYVVLKDVQSDGQAQQDYSGIYMVGKIAHQIADKKIYTHITLWRECSNTVALASLSDRAEGTSTKITNLNSTIDQSSDLMDADSYANTMTSLSKLQKDADRLKNKAEKYSDSNALKAYKNLNKQYEQLKSYTNQVFYASSVLADVFPIAEKTQENLESIVTNTPYETIRRTIRDYLNIQAKITTIEEKINSGVQSNGVYDNLSELKTKCNRLNQKVQELQSLGLIGKDLNEYT